MLERNGKPLSSNDALFSSRKNTHYTVNKSVVTARCPLGVKRLLVSISVTDEIWLNTGKSSGVASYGAPHRGASPLDFQLVIFEWSCSSDSHRFLQ